MTKFKIILALTLAMAMSSTAHANRAKPTERGRESGGIEKSIGERFRESGIEKSPGYQAALVGAAKGAPIKASIQALQFARKAEGLRELEIPMNMQSEQGLGKSINFGKMVNQATAAREVLVNLRKVAEGEGDAALVAKAEEMYRVSGEVFELAMVRFNELAAKSSSRNPFQDPLIKNLLSDYSYMMSFVSKSLHEVLKESAEVGDLGAITGFTARVTEMRKAIESPSSENPLEASFVALLEGQGLKFPSERAKQEEAQRLVKKTKENCKE